MTRPALLAALLAAAMPAQDDARVARLARGDRIGFDVIRAAFAARNPGYDLAWHDPLEQITARGRTLALAARADDLRAPASLEPVLKELEANPTRVVLISTEAGAIESVLATTVLPGGGGPGLEGAVWRGLSSPAEVINLSAVARGCRMRGICD